jgi:hypothetical protein
MSSGVIVQHGVGRMGWPEPGVTVLLQWCYNGVTVVLQLCHSGVTVLS